jgi:hypothetical protein
MTTDLLFSICNTSVLPAWILLAFAPTWKWTQRLVHSALIPLLLGLVYAGALFSATGAPEGAGMGSLAGVMALFTVPEAVLGGWVHYLIFDLFVGAWEVRDARRQDIPHWMVVPCLALTLMLGPIGLVAYLALRGAMRSNFLLEETPKLAG